MYEVTYLLNVNKTSLYFAVHFLCGCAFLKWGFMFLLSLQFYELLVWLIQLDLLINTSWSICKCVFLYTGWSAAVWSIMIRVMTVCQRRMNVLWRELIVSSTRLQQQTTQWLDRWGVMMKSFRDNLANLKHWEVRTVFHDFEEKW